ncbi:nucleoside-triphosphatase [Paenibacillus lautus]|uniref:nucleoside-triphosphatase n=1 Tax=Paenibacillus lautus TaxID=1401 RepID=UPI003985E219
MFEQSKHLVAGKPLNAKTAFLVTGKPRMGKTTMIKKLIHHLGSDLCGGFYTEEITNAGERIGFRCVAVDGESVEIANVESPSHIRVGRYGVDVEKFEDFAIHKLREALSSKKIIVIDEMGFMQMLSASFQSMVQEIISDRRIVLGTIPVESHPEIDAIKYRKEVGIISLNEINRDVMPELLLKDILNALEGGRTCG